MAALVKSAALQNACRCTCEQMLRQHSLHQQKAGLSRTADLYALAAKGSFPPFLQPLSK
jgi:hypothetical protein